MNACECCGLVGTVGPEYDTKGDLIGWKCGVCGHTVGVGDDDGTDAEPAVVG